MKLPTLPNTAVALVTGAIVFALAQRWVFGHAAPMAGVDHGGWFPNSGFGVRTIGRTFGATGLLAGLLRQSGLVEASLIVAGAILAMTIVLFSIGPGAIFPIVLAIGAAVVLGATAVGALVGAAVRLVLGMTVKRS